MRDVKEKRQVPLKQVTRMESAVKKTIGTLAFFKLLLMHSRCEIQMINIVTLTQDSGVYGESPRERE